MAEELRETNPGEGLVRLFPLPNLVLFPNVVQALHIFEPRYRQLMADSLEDNRQFAMALLQPGWEMQYENRPPIFPTVCLGEIHNETQLFDGRYNLLLTGLRRGEVIEEIPTDRLYRVARVRWQEEHPLDSATVQECTHQVDRLVREWADRSQATKEISALLQAGLSLPVLVDVMGYVLPLSLEQKQSLLAEYDVHTRVTRLLDFLQERIGGLPPRSSRPFPPNFSDN